MAEWGAIYEKGKAYEINFCSAKYEEAKAVEKVCCAIMDKKVSTPDDVQIVRHGKWEKYGCKWRCTNCHGKINLRGTLPEENGLHYCPNCGAKMDGD